VPPLFAFSIAVLLGDLLFPLLEPARSGLSLGGVALLVLAWAAGRRWVAVVALACGGLLVGLALPARLGPGPELVGEGVLSGTVCTSSWGREADVSAARWVDAGGGSWAVHGHVRVRFPGPPPPPGTAVRVDGVARRLDLTRLPGEPDPSWEAARAGVASLVVARSAVAARPDVAPIVLEGTANEGLLRALLTGDASAIPGETADLLRRTGTWHLVSVSGLHIGLAAMAGWGVCWLATRPLTLLWRFGGLDWACAFGAVAAAAAYTHLAGDPLPAVRSLWMSGIGAGCAAARRRPGMWEVWGLAAVVTLWLEPGAVANVGWQLSFGGLAGMTLVGPRVLRWVPPDSPRWVVLLAGGLATSVGATAGTLPVVAWRFQQLSPLSALANLWAVPWIGSVATPLLLVSQLLPGAVGRLALALSDAAVTVGLAGLRRVDV